MKIKNGKTEKDETIVKNEKSANTAEMLKNEFDAKFKTHIEAMHEWVAHNLARAKEANVVLGFIVNVSMVDCEGEDHGVQSCLEDGSGFLANAVRALECAKIYFGKKGDFADFLSKLRAA